MGNPMDCSLCRLGLGCCKRRFQIFHDFLVLTPLFHDVRTDTNPDEQHYCVTHFNDLLGQ